MMSNRRACSGGSGCSSGDSNNVSNNTPSVSTQSQGTQSAGSDGAHSSSFLPTQNTASQNSQNTQSDKSQAKIDKKWKLKNAELKVIDIYCNRSSNYKASAPVIKLEIKLKNVGGSESTRFVGE